MNRSLPRKNDEKNKIWRLKRKTVFHFIVIAVSLGRLKCLNNVLNQVTVLQFLVMSSEKLATAGKELFHPLMLLRIFSGLDIRMRCKMVKMYIMFSKWCFFMEDVAQQKGFVFCVMAHAVSDSKEVICETLKFQHTIKKREKYIYLLIVDNSGTLFFNNLVYLRFRSWTDFWIRILKHLVQSNRSWFSTVCEKNLWKCNGKLKANSLGLPVSPSSL